MLPHWIKKFILLILILILCLACYQHPIFEKIDLSKHEGEKLPFYFIEVTEANHPLYNVRTNSTLSGEINFECTLEACNNIRPGRVVSIYGELRDGKVIVERIHIHDYPKMAYYLSVPGLIFVLLVFFREWKFEPGELSFIWRDRDA